MGLTQKLVGSRYRKQLKCQKQNNIARSVQFSSREQDMAIGGDKLLNFKNIEIFWETPQLQVIAAFRQKTDKLLSLTASDHLEILASTKTQVTWRRVGQNDSANHNSSLWETNPISNVAEHWSSLTWNRTSSCLCLQKIVSIGSNVYLLLI